MPSSIIHKAVSLLGFFSHLNTFFRKKAGERKLQLSICPWLDHFSSPKNIHNEIKKYSF